MLKKMVLLIQSVFLNLLSNHSGCRITHVVETNDWAIKNVGTSVCKALNRQHLVQARISYTPLGLRHQLIHFDSVNTFVRKGSIRHVHPSNAIVLTWFHVEPGDPRLHLIQQAQRSIQRIHTSCQATKAVLVQAGVAEEKIVVIPLGVDLHLFYPGSREERLAIRKRLAIPESRFVIGSFQKDGVGWGEGMEPKLIKGPDVFVEVVSRLKDLNPLVLLTGPARGYVKAELKNRGVDYRHIYPPFHDIPKMYHALDLYLITSRVEGGPLALVESWASGVPVVSTQVGMVPDLAVHEQTALLADVEDTTILVNHVERLQADPTTKENLRSQALKEITNYSWDKIARRYANELYGPLL